RVFTPHVLPIASSCRYTQCFSANPSRGASENRKALETPSADFWIWVDDVENCRENSIDKSPPAKFLAYSVTLCVGQNGGYGCERCGYQVELNVCDAVLEHGI